MQDAVSHDPAQSSPQKACRWCGSLIPKAALLCKECKSYQSSWRSFTLYVGSITGILALLGSSLTFMAANWGKIFRTYRVNLVYLSVLPGHEFTGIISNSGNSPIFVSHLTVYWRGGNESFPILKTIASNEFSVIQRKDVEAWPYDGFLGTPNGEVFESLLRSTVNNVKDDEGCFVTYFYSEHADDLTRMNSYYASLGTKLVTDSARLQIHYNNMDDEKPLKESFKAVATFLQRKKPDCKQVWP
jgi:hypothetical protein